MYLLVLLDVFWMMVIVVLVGMVVCVTQLLMRLVLVGVFVLVEGCVVIATVVVVVTMLKCFVNDRVICLFFLCRIGWSCHILGDVCDQ